MSMNDNASLASPEKAELRTLDAIAALVTLLADPVAAGARVKALQDALAEHRTVVEAIQKESAALDNKRQAHLDLMTDERTAHDAKLKADRSSFETEADQARRTLATAQEAAKATREAAEAAHLRSKTLNDDLDSRLSMIAAASSAPLPARH
jgi:hypothetical protein